MSDDLVKFEVIIPRQLVVDAILCGRVRVADRDGNEIPGSAEQIADLLLDGDDQRAVGK